MSRRLKVIAALGILALMAGAFVLFVTPPPMLIKQVAISSSAWLMAGSVPSDGPVTRLAKRFLGAYIQTSIAGNLVKPVETSRESDEQVLHRIMVIVRSKTFNHLQFGHAPQTWPILVSGAGYCDQINAAVATLAAHRFPRAEVFAMWDPVKKTSPHTIGRVWSPQKNDWLYYDAFFAEPVVYTMDAKGPHFLRADASAIIPKRGQPDAGLYELGGNPMGNFTPTFAGYVASRLKSGGVKNAATAENTAVALNVQRALQIEAREESVDAEAKAKAVAALIPEASVSADEKERAFESIAKAFVTARMDHVFGEEVPVEEYRRIAADPDAKLDQRAENIAELARTFAETSKN
jgi:hypothetical protein